MALTSAVFIAFLAAAVLIYYLCPKNQRWIVLAAANTYFYLAGGIKAFGFLLVTVISAYIAGIVLDKLNNQNGDKKIIRRKKKLVTSAVCIINFGMLFIVKYLNYLVDLLSKAGILAFTEFDIIMPLGISFFIFQAIGYVIDVFRGKQPPEKNFLKFYLFVSFFPQMVQGPISRFNQLQPQLTQGHDFDYDNIKAALTLMLRGFFKKLIIADRAAVAVNAVFGGYENYDGGIILISVILYCIQLYCDFSGGIDIIRGAARLFGIDMTENFRRPVFAVSLADFWRRWHISLGSWMRDYLFYPISFTRPFIKLGKFSRKKIGGKAGKILPTSLATFIIYFVIGIWHGSSFKYIVYGFWNGAIITSSLLLEPFYIKLREKLGIKEGKGLTVFRILRTNLIIVIGRYITRAGRFKAALFMLKKTITNFSLSGILSGELLNMGLNKFDYLVIAICSILLFLYEYFEEREKPLEKELDKRKPVYWTAAVAAVLCAIVFLGIFRGNYISSEFIYKQY